MPRPRRIIRWKNRSACWDWGAGAAAYPGKRSRRDGRARARTDDRRRPHRGSEPLAIVGTAGTTSSGTVDSPPRIGSHRASTKIWFHVDGAFGAAVVFSNRHRGLVEGIGAADSITIDPHKWLALPFAAGVLLTRHAELLEPTFGLDTSYLPRAANSSLPDNFRISAQWSRRMNSLKLWLTLRAHGRQSYEELIDSQLRLAGYMEQRVLETGHSNWRHRVG